MSKHSISIDPKACIGCGLCVTDCPASNIVLQDKKASVIEDTCIMCSHCVAICPKHAVSITGFPEEPVEKSTMLRLDPQEVLEVIRFRRTIRQFQKRKIDDAVLAHILEAGRLTHTTKNLQDVSYIVLDKERAHMEQLAVQFFRKLKPFADRFSSMAKRTTIHDHFFFFNAPIAVLILAKDEINGALAAQNMEFVAEAHGLGVLYSGFFTMASKYSRRLRKALQLPKGKKVVTTLVLGYPAVRYQRSAPHEALDISYR